LTLDGGRNEGYQTVVTARAVQSPVDFQWHRLVVRSQGKRHQVFVDDQLVFEGQDDRNLLGGFTLAPGWGWSRNIECVEVDDLQVKALPAP